MQIYSSINNSLLQSQQQACPITQYNQLKHQFLSCGFTYKSNQILLKLCQQHPSQYPYLLLLYISKLYHLNQFQIIFYSHILSEVENIIGEEELFQEEGWDIDQELKDIFQIILGQQHDKRSQIDLKKQFIHDQQEQQQQAMFHFNLTDLKKTYLFLLVIGYAVKYYLNQQCKIKPYQQYIKKIFPAFFSSIFNKWAKKYGNSVLNTTPRKINSFYIGLGFLQGDQEQNQEKQNEDCQYRNYNQIVEELIRATTDGDQHTEELIKEEFIDHGINHQFNQ